MTIHRTPRSRAGATSVEFAMVAAVVLLMLIGLIVMALGVFRYQELARLAREGARYAAVRGTSYPRRPASRPPPRPTSTRRRSCPTP